MKATLAPQTERIVTLEMTETEAQRLKALCNLKWAIPEGVHSTYIGYDRQKAYDLLRAIGIALYGAGIQTASESLGLS
jgi:hypothetical protein